MSPKSGGRTPKGRHSPPPTGASSSAEKPPGGESAREESIRRKQSAESSAKLAAEKAEDAAGRREAKEAKLAAPPSASRKNSVSSKSGGGGASKAPARSGAEVAAEVDRLHLSSRPPVVRPEDVRSPRFNPALHPDPWHTVAFPPCKEEDIANRCRRLQRVCNRFHSRIPFPYVSFSSRASPFCETRVGGGGG